VDSLFMTPLQKKKKMQQLLIENQEMDDRGKSMTSSQMGEISLETIMKSEAAGQFGEKLETVEESVPSFPENMRDLELKEISSSDVTILDVSDHLGCQVEEGHDGSEGSGDEGKESDDESEEEDEDCSDSSSEHSEGEDDCSDEEEEENQDDGESETFWNHEQLEILKSALPSFHFLPRTTVDKVVTELKVLGGCPDRVKYFARVWLERRGREGEDRLQVRRRRLETVDHAQGTEPRLGKKVKFLQ